MSAGCALVRPDVTPICLIRTCSRITARPFPRRSTTLQKSLETVHQTLAVFVIPAADHADSKMESRQVVTIQAQLVDGSVFGRR